MIGIGLIGYGYWGPNLLRNFAETAGARVEALCDARPERLAQASARYPAIKTFTEVDAMLAWPAVDAVVVATPVHTHFELAMKALKAQKHVLVEKPITPNAVEAEKLIEEAERRRLTLMVDHTFIYTGAVKKIKELLDGGELGEVYYYDSSRVNLGLFQSDVSVLWDLAVHDLAILDHLIAHRPVAVSATGISHVFGRPENIAYMTLFFRENLIAHINVNWLSPVKIRQTLIGGSQKMIVYNDLDPGERVKVYDRGITVDQSPADVYKLMVSYRAGGMFAPQLDGSEALRAEATEFVRCIDQGAKPATDGQSGLRIVRILEAADKSMQDHGRPVTLKA